jgi:pyruvate kinase
MRRRRNAKIIATVGPASSSPEILKQLITVGVDTFRLNFSHGTHENHACVYRAIRHLERELRAPIGILQDLQGPKIRVGKIKNQKIAVERDEKLCFFLEAEGADVTRIPLPHPEVFAAVLPGQELLIDDGHVRVRVIANDNKTIDAEVIVGGSSYGAHSQRPYESCPGIRRDDRTGDRGGIV